MKRGRLFRPGERVGVAVSGGPDSVLLLEFMRRLACEKGLTLAVVHFHHHLRGAEADADEKFVRGLAETSGLEFIRGEADVARVAREKHRNLEATARDLRYQFFFSLVNQGQLDKVVTAHTANDQAETVLLKLLRGAGTRGLGGIYPVLEGKIVRPFLSMTRAEIERDLRERRFEFRTDSTNRDPQLRRNKIRLEVLPWLQKEFNPEIITILKDLADRARQDDLYLEQQARESARPWRVREGSAEKIPIRPLVGFPPAIARRVLRQMIQGARGSLRRITHAQIDALRRFAAEAQSGRSLALPDGVIARKEFDWLILGRAGPEPGALGFSYSVQVPGEVFVPQLDAIFHFKILSFEDRGKAYNRAEAGSLDPSKLSGELILRNWRHGDCFRPSGSRKIWKLKELFRQQKIPVGERKLWPVLESGKEIVWVRGFPPSSAAVASRGPGGVLLITEGKPTSS